MAPKGATKHPSQLGIIQTAQDGDATTSSIVVQRAATTVQHELTDTQASGSGSGSNVSQFTAKVLVPSTQDHDTARSSSKQQPTSSPTPSVVSKRPTKGLLSNGDSHPAVSHLVQKLVEEVLAWQRRNGVRTIPSQYSDDCEERKLALRFEKLLLSP